MIHYNNNEINRVLIDGASSRCLNAPPTLYDGRFSNGLYSIDHNDIFYSGIKYTEKD